MMKESQQVIEMSTRISTKYNGMPQVQRSAYVVPLYIEMHTYGECVGRSKRNLLNKDEL